MSAAADSIDGWCHYVLPRQFDDVEGWELQNMLTVARIVIDAALAREETRGVHQRTDHPHQDEEKWRCHLRYSRNGGLGSREAVKTART